MLKVFKKAEEEISKKNMLARADKGKEIACPYYVITKDGRKIDVSSMTEEQILTFYSQALETLEMSEDELKQSGRQEDMAEAIKLTDALKSTFVGYKPSWGAVMYMIEKCHTPNAKVNSGAKDLFVPLAEDEIKQVETIASFIKESKHNLEVPTLKEKLKVADQLKKNAIYRELNGQFKK